MIKLLKHDITQGTLRMWPGYLCAIVIGMSGSITLNSIITSLVSAGELFSSGTLIDYYMYSTRGLEVFRLSPESYFLIPVYWFCFHLILAFVIGHHAEDDFKGYGKNIILATKTRIGWWMAKCAWCIFSVILFYLLRFLGVFLYTLLAKGEISFHVTMELMKGFGSGLIYMENGEILLMTLVLPCLVSIAISMLQMLLSLKIGAVNSFATVCVLYIFSAYYTSPLLPGNYTMWLRNNTVAIDTNIYTSIGLLLSGFFIFLVMLIGILYIDKKDIL